MNYIPLFILVLFVALIGFASYDQYFKKEDKEVEKNLNKHYGKINKDKGKR